ncbi:right-handed parallel beta-helix repeat-containing protein [Methanocorpusculum sp. MG]|uniref:Right-handed parallel beta-helix repeat-containing protein n=1 Tax=Methanocorpusculum petauri TaxID=3002863 RepID=A0ABT4II93_9EURY|nr:right-handed parallel beta-helix repeat-containing protein [Methanocorpusculum petauri]
MAGDSLTINDAEDMESALTGWNADMSAVAVENMDNAEVPDDDFTDNYYDAYTPKTYIYITNDIALTKTLKIAGTIKLVIPEGETHTISREAGFSGPMFEIVSGGKLHLTTYTDREGNNVLDWVTNPGHIILDGGMSTGTDSLILVNGGEFYLTDGVTLTNNNANFMTAPPSESPNAEGGALCINRGTATISGGNITNNVANWYGGGIVVKGGKLTITGGTISGNAAGTYGGGIAVVNAGTMEMTAGIISGNTARGTNGGGGICLVGTGTSSIEGGKISGNTAADSNGGGIRLMGSKTLTITNCEISTNVAQKNGGGIYTESGTCTLSGNVVISGNTAKGIGEYFSAGGGGVYIKSGTFSMSGGTLSGNTYTGKMQDYPWDNGGQAIHAQKDFALSGTATISQENDVYLENTVKITVPAALTGSVPNITVSKPIADKVVIAATGSSVTASSLSAKFGLAPVLHDAGWSLRVSDGNLILQGTPLVPQNVSLSPYNSTCGNVTFTIGSGKGPAPTSVTITLTPEGGGDPITKKLTGIFPAGKTYNAPISGLKPGKAYAWKIEFESDAGTGTATGGASYRAPVPDKVTFVDAAGNDLPAPVTLPKNGNITIVAQVYNGSMLLPEENVAWSASGTAASIKSTTPASSILIGSSQGEVTLTATSSALASMQQTLQLKVTDEELQAVGIGSSPASPNPGKPVQITISAQSSTGTSFTGIPASTKITGPNGFEEIISSTTGNPVSFTPSISGTYTITTEVPLADGSILTKTTTIVVSAQSVPQPNTGSGSDSSSDNSYPIDRNGVANMGGTGITGVQFPSGTNGYVIVTSPATVSGPAEEKSYVTTTLTSPKTDGTVGITFSVPSATLTDNGLSVHDIALYRYIGGIWTQLPTSYLKEERGAAMYTASVSTGTGTFAIVYKKDGAVSVLQTTTEPTAAKTHTNNYATEATPTQTAVTGSGGITPDTTVTPTASSTLKEAPAPIAGLLIGLAAAGILRRRK